jgi:hypothetical protein
MSNKANTNAPAANGEAKPQAVPVPETKRPEIIWFRRDDGEVYDAVADSDRAKYLAKQPNFEQIDAPKE